MATHETDGSSALAPNDPYRKMERHQTRPNLTVLEGGKKQQAAQNSLKSAESTAGSQRITNKNAHSREQLARPNDPINSVKGLPSSKGAARKKGLLKGKGPLTAILFMLLGGGALLFGGQSLLGPHISNLYTQATDVQFTTFSLRNQRLFKFMLDGGEQIRVTPFSQKFTSFTPYMKSRLIKNDIAVGHLGADGSFVSGDFMSGGSRALQFSTRDANGAVIKTKNITAANFQAEYAQDANFREAYYKAKRGRVNGFFDDASDWVYRKLGLTRNVFHDFKTSGDPDVDNHNFKDTLGSQLNGTDTTVNTASHELNDNDTPDDPSDDFIETVRNGDDIEVDLSPGDTPEAKARSFASELTSKVSIAGNIVCTALRVANLANIAAFAASTANSINYFMGLTENISKMMAGEGDASAIHDVMNFFTTSTTSEVPTADGSTTVTGSPLQSNGARIILGGVIPTKYEIEAYSLESITSSARRTVFIHGGTTIGCSAFKAAAAAVSLVATGIPGGTIAKVVIGMLAETAGAIAITGIMAAVVSVIVPVLARVLFTNVLEAYTGIPAGELYTQGAAAAQGKVAQTGSAYTPGSSDAIEHAARATAEVLAQQAEIDRLHRSPFDITNSNTFLGSLFASALPLLTSSSVTAPLSTISSLTSSALTKLLPSTFAVGPGNNNTYITTYGDCETLEDIGVKGDIYCNPVFTPDLTTIDITPDDKTYEAVISHNLNEDKTRIENGSELAKFITFCANRESPFGVTDANILNALQTNNFVLRLIPVLNDVIEIVNAVEDNMNDPWATGSICTNTPNNHRWDSEFKYYQRYVEDVRILDQMGAYEGDESPVLAFQRKYYSEHPLDNSPEGYLSRITGMTKDDIAFLMEFVKYNNFLANYDPSSLAPLSNLADLQPHPDAHLLGHVGPRDNHLVILEIMNHVLLPTLVEFRKNII